MFAPELFFDLTSSRHAAIFSEVTYVWEAINKIHSFILEYSDQSRVMGDNFNTHHDVYFDGGPIIIGKNCTIEPGVYIRGPVIIGDDVTIRQGAYIRGDVLLGDGSLVGHSTEVKNSIFLDGSKAPHFAYVGDSILGHRVNLGAGTILSNLKALGGTIKIRADDSIIDTRMRKFGAVIGDDAETSCNVVLNPGTLIGQRSIIYPNTSVRGYIPADTIVKLRQEIELVSREHAPKPTTVHE